MKEHFEGIQFSRGLLFGLVVGFSIAMLVTHLFVELSDDVRDTWLTLLALTISLIAAFIALSGPQSIIRNSQSQAMKTILAEREASRAVLPLVLSNFTKVAEYGYFLSYTERDKLLRSKANGELDLQKLRFETETMETLKENIKFSDETCKGWLSALISHYQICLASTEARLTDRSVNLMNEKDYNTTCRWLVLKAITDHLWEYARGEKEIPDSMDESLIRPPFLWEPDGFLDPELISHLKVKREFYSPYRVEDFQLTQKQRSENFAGLN